MAGGVALRPPRARNKARRVLTAGPRRDKDEEKETDDLLGRYCKIGDEGATLIRALPRCAKALSVERVR